eukprot:scaffold33222_cov129-Isochrysis_galbana.AAC.7
MSHRCRRGCGCRTCACAQCAGRSGAAAHGAGESDRRVALPLFGNSHHTAEEARLKLQFPRPKRCQGPCAAACLVVDSLASGCRGDHSSQG